MVLLSWTLLLFLSLVFFSTFISTLLQKKNSSHNWSEVSDRQGKLYVIWMWDIKMKEKMERRESSNFEKTHFFCQSTKLHFNTHLLHCFLKLYWCVYLWLCVLVRFCQYWQLCDVDKALWKASIVVRMR
jgi:hypothetical protein